MTESELIDLLEFAMAPYPQMQDRDPRPILRSWTAVLGHLDARVAKAAIAKAVATSRFFPTPADILDAVGSFQNAEAVSPEAAWGEVIRAMQVHGAWKAPTCLKAKAEEQGIASVYEPWDFSDPLIGEAVRYMWGSWSNACRSCENLGVDRAQFIRMVETLTKRQRENVNLPPMIAEMARGAIKRLPDRVAASA